MLRAYLERTAGIRVTRSKVNDGLLEYAQKLASTPGKQDGHLLAHRMRAAVKKPVRLDR